MAPRARSLAGVEDLWKPIKTLCVSAMSIVKREVLTTQNPDGTYVTTTTRTRTLDRHTEYDYDYDDDVSADLVLDSCGYCCTPSGALRILQIVRRPKLRIPRNQES